LSLLPVSLYSENQWCREEIDVSVLPCHRLLLNCSAVEKSYWSGFASNYLATIAENLRLEKTVELMIEFLARICKSLRKPGIARLCCLAGRFYKLGCRTGPLGYIVWQNRFLGSLNVYKYGLSHWRSPFVDGCTAKAQYRKFETNILRNGIAWP
jgi:hypothetical protein